MDTLILHFEAPLMSFGGVTVDATGVIRRFPALSMVCGLLGNALGWDHRDWERLQALQSRLTIASRVDVPGRRLTDYQTVDLGQDHLLDDRSWTTHGRLERRTGGSSRGTHIRLRDFWADAVVTTAVTIDGAAGPTVETVGEALANPARPLFIGRKPCLPATPILQSRTQTTTLEEALRLEPLAPRATTKRAATQLPAAPGDPDATPISDQRDWANQIHTGQRWVREIDLDYGDAQ